MENTSLSLLQRAQSGEESAWRDIAAIYTPFVEHWLQKWAVGEAMDDLRQEVMLRAWRGLPTFQSRPTGSFRGWLLVISKNVVRDYFAGQQESQPVGGSSFQAWMSERPDEQWGLDAETPLPESTEVLIMRRAVMALRDLISEQSWKAFWETTVVGRSSTEVANELNITPAAVRQAKARTMKQLRELLNGLQPTA